MEGRGFDSHSECDPAKRPVAAVVGEDSKSSLRGKVAEFGAECLLRGCGVLFRRALDQCLG